MGRIRWFQISVVGFFVLFCVYFGYVTFVAFQRPSGRLGIDAAKIQQMRLEASQKQRQ